MIKKTILILFCFILITSCGKKGDPVYKGSIKNFESTKLIKVVL